MHANKLCPTQDTDTNQVRHVCKFLLSRFWNDDHVEQVPRVHMEMYVCLSARVCACVYVYEPLHTRKAY